MKVMKFGGTSVGTPQRMKEVTNLVTKSGEPVFVVLSATCIRSAFCYVGNNQFTCRDF